MAVNLNAIITTMDLLVLLSTWAAFLHIHRAKYNPRNVQWNRMNQLALFILLFASLCIIPQYFLEGRTDGECRFLHHWAGTVYCTTYSMVRVFFVLRSNLIADVTNWFGRALMGACFLFVIFLNVGFNVTAKTEVVDNQCIVILYGPLVLFQLFFIPIILDLLIATRFLFYFNLTIKLARTASGNASAPRRLLFATSMMSLSTTLVTFLVMLCVLGVIPLPDPSLMTPILSSELTYNVCAMAWPSIIIKICSSAHTRPQSAMVVPSVPQTIAVRNKNVISTNNSNSVEP